MRRREAVITGIGVVSPAGVGVGPFWDLLLGGSSLVKRIDKPSSLAVPLGAPGPPLSGGDAILDRHVRYGLLAAEEAIDQAALKVHDRQRVGVLFGTAIGGAERAEAFFRGRRPCPDVRSSFCFGSISSTLRSRLGLFGVNLTIATGCTAGLDAIGAAVDQIELGRSDCVVAGASDATLVPIVVAAFDQVGALSHRTQSPSAASRPFDSDRDGFVLGEGAAAVVIEGADHARRRHQPALARVRGWSSVCSSFHMTDVRSDGRDLVRAIRRALRRADLADEAIDLVDAHGSSTRVNDRTEAAAIAEVFGTPDVRSVPVTAQKSIMGHALGASNAMEVVGAVQMLRSGVAPPIANLFTLDPECQVAPIVATPRESRFFHVLKLSSGFGGIHTAMVVSRDSA